MKLLSEPTPGERPATAYDLLNCANEPIHIPGSIQPHGVLLVAREADLRVVYASANAERVTRIPASAMLGASLLDCLSAEISSKIIQYDNHKHLVFHLPRRQEIASGVGMKHHFDIHHHNGLIYVEIELEIIAPEVDRLPVRAQMVIDAMRCAGSLPDLLASAARGLRELSGYDRVMVYKFMEDGHGHVVTEDRVRGMVPYRDLHFPASDIPSQTRALHLLQRIQVIPTSRYEPVSMVAAPSFVAEHPEPLDMTYCGLRSVSPVHLEYIRNMGVGATLVLSLVIDGQLWGLLICHHRASKLPSPELRSTCELLSQIVSSMIHQHLEDELRVEAKQRRIAMESIVEILDNGESVFNSLVDSWENVLSIVAAEGALLRLNGETKCIGNTPPPEDALELMKELLAIVPGQLFSCDNVAEMVPVADSVPGPASGVLLAEISGSLTNGILWFRPESIERIVWAGNPNRAADVDLKTGKISPRKRFGKWTTAENGRSLPWKEIDCEWAAIFSQKIAARLLRDAENTFLKSDVLDALTGLMNRRGFEARLQNLREADQSGPAAVILLSIDRYMLVEAALGNSTAEDLVLQVAQRIKDAIYDPNIVLARLTIDQFVLLCPGCTEEDAQKLSSQLGDLMDEPFHLGGKPFHVTTSRGLAHAMHCGDEDMLWEADTALHFAKQSAVRSVSFEKELQRAVSRRLDFEQDLYRAIEQKEFSLVYQPIVTLPENEVVGFEALLRWNHPAKGTIYPDLFIHIAEEEGLIGRIGEWALAEALNQLKSWRDISGRPLMMHVNVAAQQLASTGFLDTVEALLSAEGLPADALSIEVTETALLCEAAVDKLCELRDRGIVVSVDDFGTGYSSLASLRKLPVDTVKIDKSFVQPMTEDDRSREFVSVILKLTQALGLKVIAEGVETEQQGLMLLAMGCTLVQGHLYSEAITPEAVSDLIDRCMMGDWKITPIVSDALLHSV